MSYEGLTREFSIYSEDLSLVGLKQIKVQATLQDYQSVVSALETTTIEIIDPCLDPFSLTIPV